MNTLARLFLRVLPFVATPLWGQAQEVVDPTCDLAQETPLATMVARSSIVVEGKAGARRSFWNPAHTRIYTATTITVYKVFKGQLQGNQVEFVTPGGHVGDQMSIIQDGPDALSLTGVGLFFGVPTQQGTVGAAVPAAQVLDVYNRYEGYFTYRGDQSADYNAAFSACRRYRQIAVSLYAPLQLAAGRPYQELAPFTIDTYDRYAELRTTPADAPQRRALRPPSAPPNQSKHPPKKRSRSPRS